MSNNPVVNAKTLNTHRAPFYLNMGNRSTLDECFIENSGYANPSLKSGVFGIDITDPLRSSGYLQPIAAEGYISKNNIDLVGCPTGTNKPITMGVSRYLYHGVSGANNGNADDYSFPVVTSYNNVGQKINPVLYRWDLSGNNAEEKTLYLQHMNYYRIPALAFGNDMFTFQYSEDTFTPSLIVGTTSIALVSAIGSYTLIGNVVECDIQLNTGVNLNSISGDVVIGGLPFPRATINPASNFSKVFVWALKTSAVGLGGSMTGTNVTLTKNYMQNNLSGSDILSNNANYIILTVKYTRARNTVDM
ncbi:hypothetical protein ABK905_16325 [Acerihabitans sp. KWT182]|uniref:Uncharacterized protein n=1 Tax=Acerihabitans sp. KWT182 TaxID=3157919 RepID=A0AAU7Q5R8_9GAMM